MQQFKDSVLSPGGQPISGATVTVTKAAGGAASLYSGDGTGALGSNVLTTGADGAYAFYAANGRYTLSIAASGYSTTTRDVILRDPGDEGEAVFIAAPPRDGSGDATAALQAAIGDALHVYIGGGIYNLTAPLYGRDGQTITLAADAVLSWASASAGAAGIVVAGTASASVALTADAAAGATEIDLATVSGIEQGSMLRIWSEATMDEGRTDSWIGEIVFVESVAGSTVTLQRGLDMAYATADGARAEVITPAEDFRLIGGKLVGPSASDNQSVGLLLYRAVDCCADGVVFERFDSAHFRARDAVRCYPRHCTMSGVVTNTTGYAISMMDATQDSYALECRVVDCRHAFTTNNTAAYGGIPRRVGMIGGLVNYTEPASLGAGTGGDALDTHAAALDVLFRGVTVDGATGQGVNIECPTATVEACLINGPASHGIGVHNEATTKGRVRLRNNVVRWAGRDGSGTVGDGIKISSGNNTLAAGYEWLQIDGNDVAGCPLHQVRIGTDATRTVEAGAVADNVLDARDAASTVNQVLYATNAANLRVQGNSLYAGAASQSGMRMTDVDNVTVADTLCTMADASTAAAVWIDGSSDRPVIERLRVSASGAVSLEGVYLGDSVTNAVVGRGNALADCTTAVRRGAGTSHYIEDVFASVSTTIASGAIAVSYDARLVTVDTEAAAASDDLDTISGGTAGQIIVVQSAGNARDVVAKNGTGNLRLGADKTLDHTRDKLALLCTGSEWHAIALGDNGT